mmetsp:Transcript_35760/g.93958  ORF Transcript_35760/g.93958 Transcript_35760/m.93958 type:complete len:207 (+) Transcript_35760:140-760(+)
MACQRRIGCTRWIGSCSVYAADVSDVVRAALRWHIWLRRQWSHTRRRTSVARNNASRHSTGAFCWRLLRSCLWPVYHRVRPDRISDLRGCALFTLRHSLPRDCIKHDRLRRGARDCSCWLCVFAPSLTTLGACNPPFPVGVDHGANRPVACARRNHAGGTGCVGVCPAGGKLCAVIARCAPALLDRLSARQPGLGHRMDRGCCSRL